MEGAKNELTEMLVSKTQLALRAKMRTLKCIRAEREIEP